jgi:hypothetical protein
LRGRSKGTGVGGVFGDGRSASVELARGDEHVLLPLARSASGARYSKGPIELWEHQGTTRIDWFGDILRCTQPSNQTSTTGAEVPEALSGRQEQVQMVRRITTAAPHHWHARRCRWWPG